MSDYGDIFEGLALLSKYVFGALVIVIFVPLGLWKFVEILVWLIKHLSASWN